MKIWRFTGNPENWLTALEKKAWALNTKNLHNWNKLKKGDSVIFHSTRKSDFAKTNKSAIIGFGYVGEGLYEKKESWWIQETQDKQNYWPYVVPLAEIYTYSDISKIDFNKSIENKTKEEILNDIEILLENSIPIKNLQEKANQTDENIPDFPVNGSVSGINPFYEEILLKDHKDLYSDITSQNEDLLDKRLAETTDFYYSDLTIDEAKNKLVLRDPGIPQYTYTSNIRKVRKEDAKQKRLIARIENYTCQICGFCYEYKNLNGKKAWIYEVDHINEKSAGGNENPDNLWVLCPNCHAKKTRGIITIDKQKAEIRENGKLIKLKQDNHLFIKKI